MSDPLLTPFSIRGVSFRNRILSTSHACGLEEGGMPADRYQAYHEEKARGGIGLTMFGGSSNVAVDSPSVFQQLDVGVDRIIPHLQKMSARVHKHGAKLMCQITHLGRRGEPYAGHWLPTVAPSAIRETLHRSFPKEMDEYDVVRIVRAYGDAARRCKEGGLDGIETLAGGHLIGQFLSPKTNVRTDKFGGSLANRCRFGLMVFEEIRRQVGDDFLVGFRFVIDEGDAEGLNFNACVEIAKVFEAEVDIDFFNAIFGRMDTEIGLAVDNMPGMASPIAPWLGPVGKFRKEISLPVFHAARITDIATARYAIAEGHLDMVAMTRAQIADPHLVAKLKAGEETRIRPCVGATHCMSLHRPVCLHNAATGRETILPHTIERAETPRRVVVVGGGPAGLEAARVAGERGHHVTLLEAASRLGGQVLLSTRASWRGDLIGLVDWRIAELERLGVDVQVNSYAESVDVMTLEPDLVIIATGGVPDLDWLPGAKQVTNAWDFLGGSVQSGAEVIIYDGTGRHPAPQCAEVAAMAGGAVSLFSIDGYLAAELTYSERVIWKKRAYELGLVTQFDHRLIEVERLDNRLIARFINEVTGVETSRVADQVIVEHGTVPADLLYQVLRAHAGNSGVTDLDALLTGKVKHAAGKGFELHRIGDAVASRNIAAAILDAFRLMRVL